MTIMNAAIIIIAALGIINEIKSTEENGNSSVTAAPTFSFGQCHHKLIKARTMTISPIIIIFVLHQNNNDSKGAT